MRLPRARRRGTDEDQGDRSKRLLQGAVAPLPEICSYVFYSLLDFWMLLFYSDSEKPFHTIPVKSFAVSFRLSRTKICIFCHLPIYHIISWIVELLITDKERYEFPYIRTYDFINMPVCVFAGTSFAFIHFF